VPLGIAAAFFTLFVGAGAASTEHAAQSVTCDGGSIGPGFYDSITVTGICTMPSGVVWDRGDLTIEAGAGLNAITAATVVVHGNLVVDDGGILALGCSPAIGCSFTTHDRVDGTLEASSPADLIVHSATLGSLSSEGGSQPVDCGDDPVVEGPDYVTFEDTLIEGNASIDGYTACWMGFIRNRVDGSVTLDDNHLADPDAMEIMSNVILGNLACFANTPAPHRGDSGGAPNKVFGQRFGQCANSF
jgi:hypothetical protein